jgi:transposase
VDGPGPGRTSFWPTRRIRHAPFAGTCASAASGPPAFDRETYKQRNTVERCINRLKQWRGIATRYEKTATIYLGGIATRYEKTATIYLAGLHVAGIFLWSAR